MCGGVSWSRLRLSPFGTSLGADMPVVIIQWMDAHCNPKPQELESSMRCNPTIQADSSHKPQRPGPITRRRQRQKLCGCVGCGFVGLWVVRVFRGGEHEDHAASHNALLSVCNTHHEG
jgi:hypothetical protein